MSNDLIVDLEKNGPGFVSQKLRAMAREAVLQRLEAAEAAVMAGGLRDEIDQRLAALQARLPLIAEREAPLLAQKEELHAQLVDLAPKRMRAALDKDNALTVEIDGQIGAVERQIALIDAELRTTHSNRFDTEFAIANLGQSRAALAPLIAP